MKIFRFRTVILIVSLTFTTMISSIAQCSCENCPVVVPNQSQVTSEIDVSGLTSGILGSGGQSICEIRLELETDAIREIEIVLITPSGDQIILIDRISGIGVNQNLVFDIAFLQCSAVAMPDPGYPSIFTSLNYGPDNGMFYNGSYYPGSGDCLEDLSGSANGTYILEITDFVPGDAHVVTGWEIIFCDDTGLDCSAAPICGPGDLQTIAPLNITECEGSADLLLANLTASWLGSAPSDIDYGLTFFVVDFSTGVVIERTDLVDLTSAAPGTYSICGLSYLLDDAPLLPSTTGGYTIASVEQEITNGSFCGDLSDFCTTLTIEPDIPAPDIDWPGVLCEGVLYVIPIINYDPDLTYGLNIASGGFNLLDLDETTGEISINPIGPNNINICVFAVEDCDDSETCGDIMVIDSPDPPTLIGDIGVCVGNSGTIEVTNAQPGDMYTWTISGPGSITSNNNISVDFSSVLPGNIEICASITTSCGNTQNCIDITVTDPIPPSTNATTTYCLPTNFFNGNANGSSTSILWEQISGPGTITFFNPSVVATQWDADQPGTYVIRLTKDLDGCLTFEEITIELLPADPQITLFGPASFCDNVTSTVEIVNPQPNTIYTWTSSGPATIVSDNGTFVEVLITGNGLVSICAESTGPCGTNNECWTVDAVIVAPPSANAESTYCLPNGFFNGSTNGPSDLILYSQISGPGTIIFDNPSAIQTSWTVDLAGSYTVALLKEFNNCEASEIFSFDVVEGPSTQTSVSCDNGEFTIEIIFIGGTAPYSVFGTEISGDIYTSPPYPSGSAVATVYSDDNGCGDQILVQEFCNCTTEAGTMANTAIELCNTSLEAVGIHNNDETFDADDIGQYALHTSPTNALGTIIEINATGVFSFQTPMLPYTVYYISYIAGTDDGTGSIDLNDNCLSVAIGQPVIFYPEIAISVIIQDDPVACDQSLILEAQYTPPTNQSIATAWSTVASPTGSTATFSSQEDDITTVTFSESGIYTLRYEVTIGPCTYVDDIILTILPTFLIGIETVDCDLIDGTYSVSFPFIGGTPPYTVDGANIATSIYNSPPLPIGTSYSFIVGDSGNCPSEVVEGIDNCGCLSDAGTLDNTPQLVCIDEQVIGEAQNPIFDGNDIGQYILHDGTTTVIGSILDQNTSGIFSFLPIMSAGQTYFVTYAVGNDLGGNVDLADNCLSVALGVEVVWHDYPILDLPIALSTCGDTDTIALSVTNGGSVVWSYADISDQNDGTLNSSDPMMLIFSNGSSGVHTLQASASNFGCESIANINVTVHPQGQIVNILEICDATSYTVSFDIEGGTVPYYVNATAISGSTFTSAPISSSDPYSYTITDENQCVLGQVSGSKNCDCQVDAGAMTGPSVSVCGLDQVIVVEIDGLAVLEADDIGVYVVHDSPSSDLGTIAQISMDNTITFIPSMTPGAIYYISYVVGNDQGSGMIDLLDPCLDVAIGIEAVWYEDFNVFYPDNITLCFDTLLFTNQNDFDGLDTEVRLLSDGILTVTEDSLGLYISLDAPGEYILQFTNRRGACIDIDTTFLDLRKPADLSTLEDIDICGLEVSLPLLIDGDTISYAILTPEATSLIIGDSIHISSTTASSTVIRASSNDFFCATEKEITISFSQPISIDEISFSCNDDATESDVTLVLSGGNGSYIVNSIPVPEDSIILSGIDPSLPFTISISSGNCPDLEDIVNINCGCSNTASNLPQDPLIICIGDSIISSFSSVGQYASPDTLLVLLHDGSDLMIGNILATNGQPLFEWSAGYALEDSLWMTTYIGPLDLNGSPLLQDSCATLGDSQLIIVAPEPLINIISPDTPLCIGDEIVVAFSVDAIFPIEAVVNIEGQLTSYTITSNDTISINVVLSSAITSILIDANGVICNGAQSEATIEATDCSCFLYNYDVPVGICYDGAIDLTSWEAKGLPANYEVVSGPAITMDSLLIVDIGFEGLVTLRATPLVVGACDSTYILSVNIESSTEVQLVEDSINLCPNDVSQIALDDYLVAAVPNGTWSPSSIIDPNALDIGANTFTFTTPEGEYCPASETDITVQLNPPIQYVVTTSNPDCFDLLGSIEILVEDPLTLSSIYINDLILNGYTLTDLAAGSYDVVLEDINTCSYLASVTIEEIPPLSVTINSDINLEGEGYVIGSEISGGTESYTYEWTADGESIADNSSSISFVIDNETEILLTVRDANGCTADDLIILRVPEIQQEIILPNVIRVGASTNNTISIPPYKEIDRVLSWTIYDRWGNTVYASTAYDPKEIFVAWDGTFDGNIVASGVYVYLLKYLDSSGLQQVISSDITVIH